MPEITISLPLAGDCARVAAVTELRIAKNLALPVETVTQAVAILAKRRMGKSYLARRLAEQLFASGQQLCIIDPKGDWWGIRSSADGKSDGLPILIIGGEHGDIPLDAGAGETIAKLIVEEAISVLLDLSELRKHEVATFMAVFLETIYRLKAREQFRTPLMVITDEADAIAPQKPAPNEARMLGAFNDLVRRGGQRGIGVTFITQRSAVLSKDVLTQAQILISLRVIAPQDLAAIKAWIDVHGTVEAQKTLMTSLPALPLGDAWVWSPGWPTDSGIFQLIHTLPISTFDSGATPKPGQRATAPKRLADIDLGAVKRQMAETLERAKAEDPKLLRARVVELERQLADREPETVPAFTDVELAALREASNNLASVAGPLSKLAAAMPEALAKVTREVELSAMAVRMVLDSEQPRRPRPTPLPEAIQPREDSPLRALREGRDPRSVAATTGRATAGSPTLGKGELALLTAIAQHRDGVTREQLTVLTDYKRSSRDTYLQRLRSDSLTFDDGYRIKVSVMGRTRLGPDFKPLPTGAALRRHWLERLPQGERAILQVVVDRYPKVVHRDEITKATNYLRSSRDTYLQRLRARELIDVSTSGVKASGVLFQ